MYQRIYRWFELLLQIISIALLLSLAVVVVMAVVFRFSGSSLVWYDEVASVQLAWLTYYGAALAALKRSHLGFANLFLMLPLKLRKAGFWLAEFSIIVFFAVIGWGGWYLLGVFGEETLVSLPWVHLKFTQSVIPIGAVLFIAAELISIPDARSKALSGVDQEMEVINEVIAEAGKES